jgi:hypothetical protein
MPLIRFEAKKGEGAYLLVTSGEVGWFPEGVFGVTEHLLQQLELRFQEKGIRYHALSPEEADALTKGSGWQTLPKAGHEQDDPNFDAYLEEIRRYRQEIDNREYSASLCGEQA